MSKEVIVIGGGVIGSSITYHLVRDGVNVKQLEKGSIANQGAASRATAGGLRINGRDTRELPLAKEGLRRWDSLEEELEADLEYIPAGQILLYSDRYSDHVLEEQVTEDKENGIKARIVKGTDLNDLVPSLSNSITKAIYYPSGGQANGFLTTVAFTSAAHRLGAKIITGTEVRSIVKENNTVIGVETSKGFIPGDIVINAAGAWTSALHETLGLSLPHLKPVVHQMSATYPAPLSFLRGPTISAKGLKLSLKQTIDGRIRAGGAHVANPGPNKYSGRFNEDALEDQRNATLSIVPSAGKYEVDFTYRGVEAHSKDDIPILGTIPEVKGYLIAAGFSGHGFAISPAIGMVFSEMAQGKKPSVSIDAFSINRSFEV